MDRQEDWAVSEGLGGVSKTGVGQQYGNSRDTVARVRAALLLVRDIQGKPELESS